MESIPAVSEAVDGYLVSSVNLACAGRNIRISTMRLQQELQTHICKACIAYMSMQDLISNDLIKGKWFSGSLAEGNRRP